MKKYFIGIIPAPEDQAQRQEWVKGMKRLVISSWIDAGAACTFCGHIYSDVKDFEIRSPKRGYGDDLYICANCWNNYLEENNKDLK